MPRKPASLPPPARKRRTAEEARTAILDAAERRMHDAGPGAIRLLEVAADVGVSHPTVLHHFGSREGLVQAVVQRALSSLHAELVAAVQQSPKGTDDVVALLDAVFHTLADKRHGRTFLWLALSGYAPAEDLHVRSLAEVIHAVRLSRKAPGDKAPAFADTYFTVQLPALALLTLAVVGEEKPGDPLGPKAFRRWLAKVIHEHLDPDGDLAAQKRPMAKWKAPRSS